MAVNIDCFMLIKSLYCITVIYVQCINITILVRHLLPK